MWCCVFAGPSQIQTSFLHFSFSLSFSLCVSHSPGEEQEAECAVLVLAGALRWGGQWLVGLSCQTYIHYPCHTHTEGATHTLLYKHTHTYYTEEENTHTNTRTHTHNEKTELRLKNSYLTIRNPDSFQLQRQKNQKWEKCVMLEVKWESKTFSLLLRVLLSRRGQR